MYVVDLMTRGAPRSDGKVLIIGGGIANFTNVAATFKGIIRALKEYKAPLIAHQVKIYVRRGGPNYQEGLKAMRLLGESLGVPIKVYALHRCYTPQPSIAQELRFRHRARAYRRHHPPWGPQDQIVSFDKKTGTGHSRPSYRPFDAQTCTVFSPVPSKACSTSTTPAAVVRRPVSPR